jgi:hypothetical protein
MQRRKNILLIASLVMMSLLIAFLLWTEDNNRALEVDKGLFRVNDFKTISKVVLESPTSKIELTYNGSKWKLNGEAEADRNMIDVLFATLQKAEPKRPLTSIEADSISRQLEKHGTRVSLFAGDRLEKEFYAGGNPTKTLAYFKLKDDKPYIVTIPGYRVYTAGIFELPSSGWRDKFVFGFNWRNFQELEARFPKDPAKNFKISMGRDYFGIEGISKIDTARLNTFLDQVSLLTADQFTEGSAIDSLKGQSPVMIIKVLDIAKREYVLSIFPSRDGKRDFIMGLIGDTQAALFDARKITPLIRPREFFAGK